MGHAMPTPRDVLNEILWRHDALDEVTVVYLHRGAPGDTRTIDGQRIRDLGRGFMEVESEVETAMIPYHRVLRIERMDKPVWERHGPDTLGEWDDRLEAEKEAAEEAKADRVDDAVKRAKDAAKRR